MRHNFFVFFIIICCLLTIPVFLIGPAAGAVNTSTKAVITGNLPQSISDVSVTVIDSRHATVSWNTNFNGYSRVEYGTTIRYRSFITNWTLTKSHMITLKNLLPGTMYHYRVVSLDAAGNRVESPDYTFPAKPPDPTPTVTPAVTPTIDYVDDWEWPDIPLPPEPAPAEPVPPNPAEQPGLPGLEELPGPELPGHNLGIVVPVSGLYPIGFTGLSYNLDDHKTLEFDMSSAQAAGADVTLSSDRIEIYQHHSPGMLMTFWENNLTIDNGKINRPVSRAEFETDPMNATLALGTISGSVHAIPTRIILPSFIKLTINSSIDQETLGRIRDVSSRNNLELENIAYTMDVERINLPETEAADVTMTLPAYWVFRQGGTNSIHVARIDNVTGTTELLNTEFGGSDANGNMIFRGDSPHGTSLFALFSAKPVSAQKQGQYSLLVPVMILIIIITALAVIIVYFDERRQKKS
jgi:hypothetical protein